MDFRYAISSRGSFGYFDPILVIATAMIFMKCIQASGLLTTISNIIVVKFYRYPVLLLPALMLVVMFPGMLTGSSTAAVLTAGALIAPVLIHLGVPKVKTAAAIAIAGMLGMIAPPVNIPALIICGGIDLPFIGFTLPLLVLTIPSAFLLGWYIGLPHIKKIDLAELESDLPVSFHKEYRIRLYLPLILIIFLMVGEKTFPKIFPQMGMPFIFMLGSICTIFCGKKFSFVKESGNALHDALPVLGILIGVGMFIQIMTLTGARGALVVEAVGLERLWLYLIIITSLPLMGSVSCYGAASVLGTPFALALLGKDVILAVSGLSFITSLGDLMPPTALAGIFAAQVVGEENYFKVLKHCIVPSIFIAIYGILFIIFSNHFAWLTLIER